MIVSEVLIFELTCVDEVVGSCEKRWRRVHFVCVEGQCDRAVQRDAAARRDGPAVAAAERRVHQLARLQRRHLRVDVHMLVHASARLKVGIAFEPITKISNGRYENHNP